MRQQKYEYRDEYLSFDIAEYCADQPIYIKVMNGNVRVGSGILDFQNTVIFHLKPNIEL